MLAAPEPVIEVKATEEAAVELPAVHPAVIEEIETATSYPAPETATLVEEVVTNTFSKNDTITEPVTEKEETKAFEPVEPEIKIPSFKIEPLILPMQR